MYKIFKILYNINKYNFILKYMKNANYRSSKICRSDI